jgi:F-type H+-transporting ATPase subunit b
MRAIIKPNLCVLFNLLTVLAASAAFAAEEGHGAEEYTFLGDWLPRIANFAILAVVLVVFLRKPVRDMFRNRSAEIAKSMQESRETRDRAVAALADMERKTREMEAETGRMIADAQARGEKDRQALIEESKNIVRDIQEQVKAGVAIEVQKAKADLAVEASLLAVDLAEGKIKDKIDKQDHERIVKDYIANVGGRG